MALMTAAQLREVIPELTGTAEDADLTTLIARVDAAFARYCGYPPATATASPTLESAAYTFYLTGMGGRDLVLPIRPVATLTSIEDDTERDFDGSSYLVASSDYNLRWDPNRGHVVVLKSTATHGYWSTSPGAIKVVATCGYSTAPGDVLEAARIAARQWWDRRKSRGRVSMSTPQGGSQQLADENILTDEVKLLLGSFRLPSTAIGGGFG